MSFCNTTFRLLSFSAASVMLALSISVTTGCEDPNAGEATDTPTPTPTDPEVCDPIKSETSSGGEPLHGGGYLWLSELTVNGLEMNLKIYATVDSPEEKVVVWIEEVLDYDEFTSEFLMGVALYQGDNNQWMGTNTILYPDDWIPVEFSVENRFSIILQNNQYYFTVEDLNPERENGLIFKQPLPEDWEDRAYDMLIGVEYSLLPEEGQAEEGIIQDCELF